MRTFMKIAAVAGILLCSAVAAQADQQTSTEAGSGYSGIYGDGYAQYGGDYYGGYRGGGYYGGRYRGW